MAMSTFKLLQGLPIVLLAISNAAYAQNQFNIAANKQTDVVLANNGDSALTFMRTDTRYFCHIYQDGIANNQINNVEFDPSNIQSGGGTLADARGLDLVPTFENNPDQFLNIQANEAGFHTLPIRVDSADPNNPQTARARISCCESEGRGKYNTIATPLNFLELISAYGGGTIQATVELYSFSSPSTPIAIQSVTIPASGRVDISVHDLLTQAGKSAEFGTVKVIHNGPAGLLESFVSFYEADLTMRETVPLSFPVCRL